MKLTMPIGGDRIAFPSRADHVLRKHHGSRRQTVVKGPGKAPAKKTSRAL
jgi:hypothetical protein